MHGLIEQLQRHNVLLVLGRTATESDGLVAAWQDLAQLPFRKVVTLGAAPHLVATWKRAGRSVDVVSLADTLPRIDESQVTWLALPDSQSPEWIESLLRAWFATHTLCILGCDLEEPSFKDRYRKIAQAVGLHRLFWDTAGLIR